MLDEYEKILDKYIDAYSKIKDEEESLPAEQREVMRAELLKQFNRDCAILDGKAGLEQERERAAHENELKEIDELKRLKNKEISEDYRLKHIKLELETELQKTLIEEETATKKTTMTKEFEILREAESESLNIKRAFIVPKCEDIKYHWWQKILWWRCREKKDKNYAYELAEQKGELEANKYLSEREDEIIEMRARQEGTDGLKVAVEKILTDYFPEWQIYSSFNDLISTLCEMISRREMKNSEQDVAVSSDVSENTDNDEIERKDLQRRAAAQIIAICKKRVGELTDVKPEKKPRKRKIRQLNDDNGGNLNDS